MNLVRNWCRNVIEKPIMYIVLLIAIILCVLISCTFYRMAKYQAGALDTLTTTYYSDNNNIDNAKLYDMLSDTNIAEIIDRTMIEHTIVNGNTTSHLSTTYYREYKASDEYFTQAELDSRKPIAIITTNYSEELGVEVGDSVNYGGVDFLVIRKVKETGKDVFLTGSVAAGVEESAKQNSPSFTVRSDGKLSNETKAMLEEVGLSYQSEKGFQIAAIVPVVLGIIVIALSALNIFVAYNYIQRKNTNLYFIYKTVGAKNRAITSIMTFEMIIIVVCAFFIGIAIEHTITNPLTNSNSGVPFTTLGIGDYAALFFVNLGAVFLTFLYKIIKISRAKPADKKLLEN